MKDWGQKEKGVAEDKMIESITDSMGMNLRKLQEIVKDREAWRTITHRIQRVGHNLATGKLQSPIHLAIQQKLKHCKVTILQLNN